MEWVFLHPSHVTGALGPTSSPKQCLSLRYNFTQNFLKYLCTLNEEISGLE